MLQENSLRKSNHADLVCDLISNLWHASLGSEDEHKLLAEVLPHLGGLLEAKYVAVFQGRKGHWLELSHVGNNAEAPTDLFAEALDQENVVRRNEWWAVPLDSRSQVLEVLTGRCADSDDQPAANLLQQVAQTLKEGLQDLRDRRRDRRRIDRLESILKIAATWNQAQDTDSLLIQMAQASTERLEAERASIFLWDRKNKQLVGRPALGVEGSELRIPDNQGIVGQVVQKGQSRRVDADINTEQAEINRGVDEKLGFKTKSLICVPLRGRSGELFGAFEVINKFKGNFTDDDEVALAELATHAAIALENTQEREQLLQTRNQIADQAAQGVQLIGESSAIEALRSTVSRVANTDLAILILGENGTGKEVVSQLIHYMSSRRNEPFVAVNCAALTETLLESELFGHEKGAFTDAHESRAGKFELASGGTLFLDEIGDMSPSGQAKLLRVLEEKIVIRVGGSKPIHTDARVLAATNQDLAAMVRAKKFREDLFFRLNVVTLELPPLRERGDDVLMLAEHFLREFCAKARRRAPAFTAAARKRLVAHNWPGNVRELRNLMERLAYLSQGDKIDTPDLAFILPSDDQSHTLFSLDLPLNDATRHFQIEYIKKQIERTRGNMTDAAKRLGLHRSNLYRKMRQLDMPSDDEESDDSED